MANFTISLTDAQEKAISYVGDVQMWIQDAAVGLSNHEKKLILSNSSENIIPRVVKIAIKEDTNNKPFKITSTSSLALLLFFIFFKE